MIHHADVERLRAVLGDAGFVQSEGGRSFNFAMADRQGREVDVHAVVMDSAGNGLYGSIPGSSGEMYPVGAFGGSGLVDGERVRCVTAEFLVTSRSGYELHESDFHDVQALHRAFGIELPPEYTRWEAGHNNVE